MNQYIFLIFKDILYSRNCDKFDFYIDVQFAGLPGEWIFYGMLINAVTFSRVARFNAYIFRNNMNLCF